MKRQAYLHWGFCPADYSVYHTVYPHETLAPAYGFGVYETVWTFPNSDNTLDRERFIRSLLVVPRNSILYINHESGKYAWSNTGDIRKANSEYLAEHKWLINMVRLRRPDLVYGDFNFAPYVGYLPDDSYLAFIRQANAVRYEAANGQSFLLPHLYQRASWPIVKDGKTIGEKPLSAEHELWSFGQCLTAAREQWPFTPIIPTICLQYNHRVCEVYDNIPQDRPTGFNFRWTPEELGKCRLPKDRLYALLQLLSAHKIERVLIWSAGMTPVDAMRENLDLVKQWCNS